jgi:hypothetical protein
MTDEEHAKMWDRETKLTSCELEALDDQHREAEDAFKATGWTHPVTKMHQRWGADEQTAMALWAIATELKLISMCLRRAYPPPREEEDVKAPIPQSA